jgi:hypothetical protein
VDEGEAREILEEEVQRLRARGHAGLLAYFESEHKKVKRRTGAEYMVETQAFWDSPRVKENLRLIVIVSEWRPSRRIKWDSVTDGFIMRPDGSFIDE